ncbi:peptidase C39 family protein [Mycolicibacterium sp. CH28]|uniref:peptidase C39 family protein n=1 Tax=Mycolicibacterium sp. CH28 TaxID=2512237 RepID=UPI001386DCE6|nr:peptidase C39 family protein [Mycolicibacterium sp. CH28]
MTVLDHSVVEGAEAIAALLGGGLADLLGPEAAAHWGIRREQYCPRVLLSADPDGITAAALLTNRPATAAVKIVGLWCREAGFADAMLERVVALANQEDAVVVKWELRRDAELPASASALGFVPMQPKGQQACDEPVSGFALWLVPVRHAEPMYYAQTTEFTCGAVAALLAAELSGLPGFAGDRGDRRREIDFWRTASNFPACEPVGLAVAMRRYLADNRQIEVALHPDTPALLDDFEGFDREFRIELQDDSRQQAADLLMPVRCDRVDVTEIAQRIMDDDIALLLITQTPMHGHDEPHWITAHASDGRSFVIVQDPWIDKPGGETWLDGHDLPIRLSDLDRMCRWGSAEQRGVVFLARR